MVRYCQIKIALVVIRSRAVKVGIGMIRVKPEHLGKVCNSSVIVPFFRIRKTTGT
jgi:hypothetical protein